METRNHLELAKKLANNLNIKGFNRLVFVFGSIYPDVNVITHIRGHYFRKTKKSVYKKIHMCMNNKIKEIKYYWNMGVVQHYIGDYFTFTHTIRFKGNVCKHKLYERKLRPTIRKYIKSNRIPKKYCFNERNLLNSIENELEKYSKEKVTYESDVKHIIKMVSLVVYTLEHTRRSLYEQ